MDSMTARRMLGAGAKSFTRGGAVSVATVLIMTVTLGIISLLILTSALLSFTLGLIRDKVDVSVYFAVSATDTDITAFRSKIEALPQVASTSLRSREETLTLFRARHEFDQTSLQSLEELGGNPFGASLEVHGKDPAQYESIVKFVEATPALSADGTSVIDRTDYPQNKDTIDGITHAITAVREIGFAVVLLFALASILITFATIRLAIYTAKDEIAVMRLVGANNAYIRGPFVVAGVITGLLAAGIVILLLFPATWYIAHLSGNWLGGWNALGYYASNFLWIALALLAAGVLLGSVAAMLAIRRYLKV